MYGKDRHWGLIGIILFFCVGMNLGEYGSFLFSIAENVGRSLLLVEL